MRPWDCRHITFPRQSTTPLSVTPGFLSSRRKAWDRITGTLLFEPRHWEVVPGRNDVDVTRIALRHRLHDFGHRSLHTSRCAMCCTTEESVAMLCLWLLRCASFSLQVAAALVAANTHAAALVANPVACNQASRTAPRPSNHHAPPRQRIAVHEARLCDRSERTCTHAPRRPSFGATGKSLPGLR